MSITMLGLVLLTIICFVLFWPLGILLALLLIFLAIRGNK
jgi:hypothetical protein